MEARFPTLEGKTSVNRVYPNFLHPCEAELAAYLDGHQIPWLYKPLRFSLPQPLRFFNPHFLLTEDFTLLMSVRTRQGYHQIKNKYTALAETYPELPIQVTCPDGTPYQTRRGLERAIFWGTIVAAVLFAALALANLFLTR